MPTVKTGFPEKPSRLARGRGKRQSASFYKHCRFVQMTESDRHECSRLQRRRLCRSYAGGFLTGCEDAGRGFGHFGQTGATGWDWGTKGIKQEKGARPLGADW
jgi:hypothetical protein